MRNAPMTTPTIERLPDGKYEAVISQSISLGSKEFSKSESKWFSEQVLIGFELVDKTYEYQGETTTKIQSMTVFYSVNRSRNGIGLREIIEAVEARTLEDDEAKVYDTDSIVGHAVIVELNGVESKGKVYTNIVAVEGVSGEKEASIIAKAKRNPILISPDDFGNDSKMAVLPAWIYEKIQESKEYQEAYALPKTHENVDADGIPTIKLDDEPAEEIRLEDIEF